MENTTNKYLLKIEFVWMSEIGKQIITHLFMGSLTKRAFVRSNIKDNMIGERIMCEGKGIWNLWSDNLQALENEEKLTNKKLLEEAIKKRPVLKFMTKYKSGKDIIKDFGIEVFFTYYNREGRKV